MLPNIQGQLDFLEMEMISYDSLILVFFFGYITEAIIKEAYEHNFGTAYETYKQSVKQDSSIRLQDAKDYFKA